MDFKTAKTDIVPLFGEYKNEDESLVVAVLLDDALAAGYTVSIVGGSDEYEVACSTSLSDICAALGDSDDARVDFHHGDSIIGRVWLVFGNSPWEVVSDYTSNDLTISLLKRSDEVGEIIRIKARDRTAA